MNTRFVLRSTLATVAMSAIVGLSACGGDSSTNTSSPSTAAASQSAPAATFNDADVQFATGMIPHHQQAVTMADYAATRAGSAQVKELAAQIKAAQGPEIQKMSGWLTGWGKPVPPSSPSTGSGMGMEGMPGMMGDADVKMLMGAKGTLFDRMFLKMMITHHEGAITMSRKEQAGGTNADATQLAGQIISAQTAEIATMKQLVDKL